MPNNLLSIITPASSPESRAQAGLSQPEQIYKTPANARSSQTQAAYSRFSSIKKRFANTLSIGSFDLDTVLSLRQNQESKYAITLEEVAQDAFGILDASDVSLEAKKNARENLLNIFSEKRDRAYYRLLLEDLLPERDILTKQLALSRVIQSVASSLLSRKRLYLEHRRQEWLMASLRACLVYMDRDGLASTGNNISIFFERFGAEATKDSELYQDLKLKNRALHNFARSIPTRKNAEQYIDNINLSRIACEQRFLKIVNAAKAGVAPGLKRQQIESKIADLIDAQVRDYASAPHNILTSAAEVDVLAQDLGQYLFFQAEQTKLAEHLEHQADLTIVSDALTQVSAESCTNVYIDQVCAHHNEQSIQIMGTSNMSILDDAYQSGRSLREYLISQMKETQIQTALFQGSNEELNKILEEERSASREMETCRGAIMQEIAEYESAAQETRNQLKRQSILVTVKSPLVTALIDQPISVLLEDSKGRNALDNALLSKDFAIIYQVLVYAKYSKKLVSLLHSTLSKIVEKTDKIGLRYLRGGLYLINPKNKGLFDSDLIKEINGLASRQFDDESFGDHLVFNGGVSPAQSPTKASAQETSSQKSVDWFSILNEKNDLFSLPLSETEVIDAHLLRDSNERELIHFINHAGDEQWPHNIAHRGDQIRAELHRRYLGENKERMSDKMAAVLNKNLAIVDDAETLGAFFGRATRHVCMEYKNDPSGYKNKIEVLLTKIEKSAESLPEGDKALIHAADTIATDLAVSNSTLAETRPGTFAHVFDLRAVTQKLVVTAKEVLNVSGMLGSIRRSFIHFTTVYTELGRQDDGSILMPSTPCVEKNLDEKLLKRIPITSSEKEACMKRAVLAQSVFKKTLDYLKTRKYDDNKKIIMDEFIQYYVDGHDQNNAPYTADNLVADLERAKQSTDGLGKRVGWKFWTPTTVGKLNKDLANKEAFIELHKELGLTAVPAG